MHVVLAIIFVALFGLTGEVCAQYRHIYIPKAGQRATNIKKEYVARVVKYKKKLEGVTPISKNVGPTKLEPQLAQPYGTQSRSDPKDSEKLSMDSSSESMESG